MYKDEYRDLLKKYEKDLEYSVGLGSRILPPDNLYVEVRVVKEIGEIITEEG